MREIQATLRTIARLTAEPSWDRMLKLSPTPFPHLSRVEAVANDGCDVAFPEGGQCRAFSFV
jgi:hypothetical protein